MAALTKAGNYAIATTKAQPWLATPVTSVQPKARKVKAKPIVVHSIFQECAQMTTDPYWLEIYESAALGKFPRGFLFKDGYLTYKRGTKITKLFVPSNVTEAFPLCTNFFTSTAGLMSIEDQERAKRDYEIHTQECSTVQNYTWNDIKSKRLKQLLLGTFIAELAKMYDLTPKEKNEASTLINLGFFLGYFQSCHVIYESGRIRCITGLQYCLETRAFSIDPTYTPKAPKPKGKHETECKSDGCISFMYIWTKFLENLEKRGKANKAK